MNYYLVKRKNKHMMQAQRQEQVLTIVMQFCLQ